MAKYEKYNDYELVYLYSWHSEEALDILMRKYDSLIIAKLIKFNVLKFHYPDYVQELRMTVFSAIRKYDEYYGKTLCRFLELIIDRKIMRMLSLDCNSVETMPLIEDFVDKNETCLLERMVYEQKIYQIRQTKLDCFKEDLFNKVLLQGVPVKEYAKEHNLSVKEVYNHIYLLRLKIKEKINL